ncbi:cobalt/nickel transport system permease protein [Thermodesulfobium acidiphilum]|uniref:Cobalt/nickel transport system permease protein n=2 Tax=Thermodesulfobium acidiphilum TaxID=1794699 RepID=A0A2R4W035_THEAF|nr:cobalt/nickel transport system permease protein [Thermodesulfobium acidiphilum]
MCLNCFKTNSTKSIKPGFMEKTINELNNVMKEEFIAGKIASRHGLLQSLDPRINIISTLLLIITANFIHQPVILLFFNIWVIWLAKVSLVPIKSFLKRVWLIVPLFTVIMVIPSIFSPFLPGEPLLVLFYLPHPVQFLFWQIPQVISITKQGIFAAIVLVLRVGICVSLSLLLTLTTKWSLLLKALSKIGIPPIFISILEMAHRYIYLLLQTTVDMFIAKKSRTVGRTTTGEQRQFLSNSMSILLGKSYFMSNEVYSAMTSRGYNGKALVLTEFKVKLFDWLWLIFIIIVCLFFIGGDRLFVWK